MMSGLRARVSCYEPSTAVLKDPRFYTIAYPHLHAFLKSRWSFAFFQPSRDPSSVQIDALGGPVLEL